MSSEGIEGRERLPAAREDLFPVGSRTAHLLEPFQRQSIRKLDQERPEEISLGLFEFLLVRYKAPERFC